MRKSTRTIENVNYINLKKSLDAILFTLQHTHAVTYREELGAMVKSAVHYADAYHTETMSSDQTATCPKCTLPHVMERSLRTNLTVAAVRCTNGQLYAIDVEHGGGHIPYGKCSVRNLESQPQEGS
jgi:hypothetical protein